MNLEKKWENHARLRGLKKLEDAGKAEETVHETFTEEAQERRRNRADKPFFPRITYYNNEASKDGIRHFANGIGDPNPLFRDEEHAKKSKYGCIIAPGSYLYTVYWVHMGSGGPGVHGWYSGGEWEWYRPLRAGDAFRPVVVLRDLVTKKGKMGGGRTWIDYSENIYLDQNGDIIAKEILHSVAAERSSSGKAGAKLNIPKPVFSKKEWIEILELYENEELRGAEPRYWEDVNINDPLRPMIKGPLSVRDEIAWCMGAGAMYFRAHKIEYDFERSHPTILEYIVTEETDHPGDVPELCHILNPFAKGIGVERAYDWGNQRMAWLCNFLTNWMGDDGFLWKMNSDLRAFNLMGDVTRFEGKVVNKYIEDGKYCVDIEAWATNQRGEPSMTPNISTVILPSKEHGSVKYPDPSSSLAEEVKKARPLTEMIEKGLI